MEAIIKIESRELTDELLLKIKHLFEGKPVTITIKSELDDTDYLLSGYANKKHLHESIASEPTVTFTPDEFSQYVDHSLGK